MCDACGQAEATHPVEDGEMMDEWACDDCLCPFYIEPYESHLPEGDCVLKFGHKGECDVE